jgi:flagellar motility protein MotE (MotC chaperone)
MMQRFCYFLHRLKADELCRLEAEEYNRALKEEVQDKARAAEEAARASAEKREILQRKLQQAEAELAGMHAKLKAAHEQSEKKLQEHWESTRQTYTWHPLLCCSTD